MMEWHPPSMEEAESHPELLYDFLINEDGISMTLDCDNNKDNKLICRTDSITRHKAAVNILFT